MSGGLSDNWQPSRHYRNIVLLTGAGISAESGLGTFRGAGGIWEQHRVEDVATPEAYARQPELVMRFYNERRSHLLGSAVQPNPAHFALVELERAYGSDFLLVTQNVDDLHERAGSDNMLHMHGELCKMRCIKTGRVFDTREEILHSDPCPCCGIEGRLRPHVVWFGEMPLFMEEIYAALAECELFIAIGTSGNVYPASGFFQLAAEAGAETLEINLEPGIHASQFDAAVYGPASSSVPAVVSALLQHLNPDIA